MAFEFHLPDIGEGVVEGEIVAWRVAEGDTVTLDQPIVEVMTDKATVEIPSPRAGKIAKINYQAGQICPVGKVLLVIDDGSGSGNGHVAPPAAAPALATHVLEPITVIDATEQRSRVLATPATRRLARQMGVDLGKVTPTGKRGRVTSEDVKGFAAAPQPAAGHAMVPARGYAPQVIASGGDEERIPLRGIRKRIAESMTRSVHTAAHFTYVEEVDMTDLVAVRDRAKAKAADRGVKLNYLPFIVKAVVSGLKKWPMLNASLDESTQEIVRKKYYHIGIAAQGPHGLAVSVVRDADRRSIFDLSREIDRLGEAVRNGTATRDDLTGSTFTISSLGKLGGVMATPIINFPEVAIIGVHKIEEKPAVRNGQIVIRHLMNLSISIDHRLADGWDGAMFLQDVKTLLEDPTTMFIEMV
jgi:pyruvate dehydrogenase E2 component (dihydrolipoamide acetyltransferase)